MLLARSLRMGFAALLALHLVSAFAAIALLGRMRPALEQILARNVHSLQAVEEMMAVLAAASGSASDDQGATRFRGALSRAANNITEQGEEAIIATIERNAATAFEGDARARVAVAEGLLRLADINRAAIEHANRDAQRLGTAGAWAMAFLALLTLLTGIVALRRLDRRVLLPVSELCDVLVGARAGAALRRCQPLDATGELAQAMRSLNELADEVAMRRADSSARKRTVRTGDEGVRAIILRLLDMQPVPTAVIDADGGVLAANSMALERLAAKDGDELRRILRAAARGDAPAGVSATRLAGGDRLICSLEANT